MRTIAEVTVVEKMAYRLEVRYRIRDDGGGGDLVVIRGDEGAVRGVYSPVVGDGGGCGDGGIADEMKRMNGMGRDKRKSKATGSAVHGDTRESQRLGLEFTHWTRPTSVHPHMMLGYLLRGDDGNDDDPAMLKRYDAESVAHSDEVRARMATTGRGVTIAPLLPDMPYRVDEDLRAKFVKRHRGAGEAAPSPPIKVGSSRAVSTPRPFYTSPMTCSASLIRTSWRCTSSPPEIRTRPGSLRGDAGRRLATARD